MKVTGLQGQLTIEVELQSICIDMIMGYIQLAGNMLHNTAKSPRDKKDLHISLMKSLNKLPGMTRTQPNKLTQTIRLLLNESMKPVWQMWVLPAKPDNIILQQTNEKN